MPRRDVPSNPNTPHPHRSRHHPPGSRSITVHVSSNEPGEEVWVGVERTGPVASRQTVTVTHQVNFPRAHRGRAFKPSRDVPPPHTAPQWSRPTAQSSLQETAPLLASGDRARRDYNSFQNMKGPPPPYDDNTYDAVETGQASRLSANNAVV